jgi:hypothetical protein
MVAPVPIVCTEKRRLLQAFTDAVAECNRMQSAQLEVLLREDRFDFEVEIAKTAELRELAKCAVISHQQKHGC